MGWYDRYVLPRILDAACGMKIVGEQRAKIVGLARGVVLEPGIGGGLNLPFYQPSAVSKLIGVDPSVELGSRAKERSASVPFPVELWSQSAEVDVVAPESVDTVVFTYTRCARCPPLNACLRQRTAPSSPMACSCSVSTPARPTRACGAGRSASSPSGKCWREAAI